MAYDITLRRPLPLLCLAQRTRQRGTQRPDLCTDELVAAAAAAVAAMFGVCAAQQRGGCNLRPASQGTCRPQQVRPGQQVPS